MEKIQITETSLAAAKQWENSVFLEDDLLLVEHMSEVSLSQDPRRTNFILVGLCTHGHLSYNMDTQRQVVNAGDMFVVSERHVIDNYQASADLDGLCFMVSVKFFHEIIQNIGDMSALFLFAQHNPVVRLNEHNQQTFKEYYAVIRRKIQNADNHFLKDLVRTLLLALLYDLGNIIYHAVPTENTEHQSRADVIFNKFIAMVESNYKRERRVNWYAKQQGITPKYLSECVKHVSRRTPNEWIDNYVLLELRILMRNSTKSIKDITVEMNFPNQSFLGKYFKEHIGMSPSEYRRK